MISTSRLVEDPLSDEVGVLLVRMNAIPSWTRAKAALKKELLERLEKEGYYFFWTRFRAIPLRKIGKSYLYRVPEDQSGELKRFRGKRTRIARVGSSTFDVEFAAKVVESPPTTVQ